MKKLVLIFLFVFFPLLPAFPETGERLTVDGYNLHISASKLSSELVVLCQISGGDSTQRLNITIGLSDDSGHGVTVNYICKNYQNSAKFSVKKALKHGGDRWKVLYVNIN
jgi:hypothetical protein